MVAPTHTELANFIWRICNLLRGPYRPSPNQTAIIAYLDNEIGKIDRLITRADTAVEGLLEYRAALITNAVTGETQTSFLIWMKKKD